MTNGFRENRISLEPGINRFVWLTDIHVPDNINLKPLFKFIKSFAPHHIIGGGDIFDMTCFNHWVRNKPKLFAALPTIRDYYRACEREFSAPLRAVAGDARLTFIKGNHEAWADKEVVMNPTALGDIEVENRINLPCRWIPQFEGVWLGQLFFIHGEHARGKYHSNYMLTRYHRNVRYGHRHDIQEFSEDRVDGSVSARCGGTLQKKLPTFMQKMPNNWQHSFGYGWVNAKDGSFTDVAVRVDEDGSFIAEGRRFE